MEEVLNVVLNIVRAVQLIGGGIAAIFLCITGMQFMIGGRNNIEGGKSRLIFTVIGLLLVVGCEVLATWLKTMMPLA